VFASPLRAQVERHMARLVDAFLQS